MENEVSPKPSSPKFDPLWEHLDRKLHHIVFVSGRGTGKTFNICGFESYVMDSAYSIVVSAIGNWTNLNRTSYATLQQVNRRMGTYDNFDWVESRNICRNNFTGSINHFIGVNADPEGTIKGIPHVDLCFNDEAQNFSELAIDTIPATVFRDNPDALIVWAYNPRYKTDPIYKKFPFDEKELKEKGMLLLAPDTLVVWLTHEDNPFFNDTMKAEMEADFSRDPAKARNIWYGDFLDASSMRLCPVSLLIEAQKRSVEPSGDHILGLDIGGGGDDSVLTDRQGNYIHGQWAYSEADPHALCSLVAKQVRATAPIGSTIYYDSGGIGWGIGTILEGLLPDYSICAVNFGSKPINTTSNALNRRAEMAQNVIDKLRGGLSLRNCRAGIIDQIMAIDCYENVGGKLQLSSKDDVRKLIGRSTDDFDSLMLACAGESINIKYEDIEEYSPHIGNSEASWMA